MKASDLKTQSDEELEQLDNDLRNELFKLRLQYYAGQLKVTSGLKTKRKDIARVQTELQSRRIDRGETPSRTKRNRRGKK